MYGVQDTFWHYPVDFRDRQREADEEEDAGRAPDQHQDAGQVVADVGPRGGVQPQGAALAARDLKRGDRVS